MNKINEILQVLRNQGVAQATFSDSGALTAVTFFDGPLPASPEPDRVRATQGVGRDGLTQEQQIEQYGTALDVFEE